MDLRIYCVITIITGLLFGSISMGGELLEDFLQPPDSARPGVYWYFMDGNISGDEMTADL